MTATVHIIGAGLAGLSAALKLSARGRRLIVHEATAFAGGRCRSYYDASVGMTIDNGNHLLLSGNRAALDYLRSIGAADRLVGPPTAEFPFVDLAGGERWTLRFNDGRLPFWVFDANRRVPGTRALDYLPLAQLLWAPPGKAVGEVIACDGVLYRRLVEPLLLAALNIDPPQGSVRLAAAIIRETLAAGGRACRPLIARDGLGSTLIEPALVHLQQRGATVRMEHQLRALRFGAERIEALDFGSETITLGADDTIILTVPPYVATSLVPGLDAPTEFRAIVNAHFRIEPPAAATADPRRAQRHGTMAVRLSRQAVRHHQRRRPAHRRAAGGARQDDLERGRAYHRIDGRAAGRTTPLADRARTARDLLGHARARRQTSRTGHRGGAISSLPAIGQIPACPLPLRARSDPATAPPK